MFIVYFKSSSEHWFCLEEVFVHKSGSSSQRRPQVWFSRFSWAEVSHNRERWRMGPPLPGATAQMRHFSTIKSKTWNCEPPTVTTTHTHDLPPHPHSNCGIPRIPHSTGLDLFKHDSTCPCEASDQCNFHCCCNSDTLPLALLGGKVCVCVYRYVWGGGVTWIWLYSETTASCLRLM